MNEKNHDYLQDQLKYLGFGEQLKDTLTEQLKTGNEKFSITFPVEKENQNATYALNFSKSKAQTDMYFFNSFKLDLTNDKKETLSNTFQVNGFKGVTAKEAINLLEGRSVKAVIDFKSKEGTSSEKEVFIQIDKEKMAEKANEGRVPFKYFSENYGIDTSKILEKSPVGLPYENHRDDAIKSLEKGNFVKVNFSVKGEETSGLISLNAQYKSLDYYSENGVKLDSRTIDQKESKSIAQGQDAESASLKR